MYIPAGYDASTDRYPVLYWIPGLWGSADGKSFQADLDKAILDGVIPPALVVFIDVQEGIWFLNSPLVGNWEDFLVSELVPFVDKTYRTIPIPQARALMGHSTGGYSALLLPALHPNIWGGIGLNDPSVSAMWYPLVDKQEIKLELDASKPLTIMMKAVFKSVPKSLEEYKSATLLSQLLVQNLKSH